MTGYMELLLSSFQEEPEVEDGYIGHLFLLERGSADKGKVHCSCRDILTSALAPLRAIFNDEETLRTISRSKHHPYDLTIQKHKNTLENLL